MNARPPQQVWLSDFCFRCFVVLSLPLSGSLYNLLYSPQSVGVSVSGQLQGAPASIPALYDPSLEQHASAVYAPDYAPSPAAPVDSAPVFRSTDPAVASAPDSSLPPRGPDSKETPAETDPPDPAQPVVVATELQRVGSWGMTPRASETLHVAFFIIAGVLGGLAVTLAWYALHTREELAALRKKNLRAVPNGAAASGEGLSQAAACATSSTTALQLQINGAPAFDGLTAGSAATKGIADGELERSSSALHRSKRAANLLKSDEGVNAGAEGEEGVVHPAADSHTRRVDVDRDAPI